MLLVLPKKIRFFDSLSIFQQPLSSLPDSFGFGHMLKKGTFAIGLLKTSATNIRKTFPRSVFPPIEHFETDFMSQKKYEDFITWHADMVQTYIAKRKRYDFDAELLSYCLDDCRVLLVAIMKFRELFQSVTTLDPLTRNFTLASIALEHFLFTKPNDVKIGITPVNGYARQKSAEEVALYNLIRTTQRNVEGFSFCRRIFGDTNEGDCVWEQNKRFGNFFPDLYCSAHNKVIEYNSCYFHFHGETCREQAFRNRTLDSTVMFKNNEKVTVRQLQQGQMSKEAFYNEQQIEFKNIWSCSWFDDEVWKNCNINERSLERERNIILRARKQCNQKQLDPRDALFGGRTCNFAYAAECKTEEEAIHHFDVCR